LAAEDCRPSAVHRAGSGERSRKSVDPVGVEQAELLGADRLTYWQMNREGFQTALTKLGLTPRGPRMP
jgi:hypothetical protein